MKLFLFFQTRLESCMFEYTGGLLDSFIGITCLFIELQPGMTIIQKARHRSACINTSYFFSSIFKINPHGPFDFLEGIFIRDRFFIRPLRGTDYFSHRVNARNFILNLQWAKCGSEYFFFTADASQKLKKPSHFLRKSNGPCLRILNVK